MSDCWPIGQSESTTCNLVHATEKRIGVVNYASQIHMPEYSQLVWDNGSEWSVRADTMTTCVLKPPFNSPWCATTIDLRVEMQTDNLD
jgi:hypothetical protein